MPNIELPKELTKGFWDRKKGAVPAGSDVESKLKVLQKKHESVDWKALDDGWAKNPKSAEALKEDYAAVDRTYRTKVVPLKMEAEALSSAAQKMGKEKGASKETLTAAKEIADAVKGYAKAIESGLDDLEKLYKAAQASVKDVSGDEDDEDTAADVLLDPKRLLVQLRRCKGDPTVQASFAFVEGDATHPPGFIMHAKMSPKTLFAKLQVASGQKKGAFGKGRIDGAVLYLQVEKASGGLVKKARLPIKLSGFKITKIVLEDENGALIEQDEDLTQVDPEDAKANAPAPTGDEARYTARLKALAPAIANALTGLAKPPASKDAAVQQAYQVQLKQAQDAKLKASESGVFARKKDWAQAQALLDQVEQLLEGIKPGAPSDAPAPSGDDKPQGSGPTIQPTVAFTQTRLVWDQTRKKIQAELRKLEASILDTCKDEPDLNEIAAGTKNLYEILEVLDERLIDKLDEAYNAADPQQRKALNTEAREIVDEYVDFVNSEPLMQDIDDNGFTSVAIRSTLTASLTAIGNKLKAYGQQAMG